MATAIILAAGFSRRFSQGRIGPDQAAHNKLLTIFHHKPLVQHAMDLVASLNFDQTILVYRDVEVKKLAPRTFQCVYNPHASEGISSSVKCGVGQSGPTDAFVFFMGDQPLIDKNTVSGVLQAFYDGKGSIIVPVYVGQRGNPVLFDAKWRDELLALTGDSGGRRIIEANPDQVVYVESCNPKAGRDIDTWDEWLRLRSGEEE